MDFVTPFLIGIVVIIALFLLFRAVALWYWKIDKIVDLLIEIKENTKREDTKEKDLETDIKEQ